MQDGKFALIICGPIVSGKTSLAEKLSTKLKLPLINETTTGNYYKIIDHIDPFRYPKAIYEHCYIYRKWYIFQALYKKAYVFILNPSYKILIKNYENRAKYDTTGDFIKIDPMKQKDEILSEIHFIKSNFSQRNHKLSIFNINHYNDYSFIYEKIFHLYSTNI